MHERDVNRHISGLQCIFNKFLTIRHLYKTSKQSKEKFAGPKRAASRECYPNFVGYVENEINPVKKSGLVQNPTDQSNEISFTFNCKVTLPFQ
jgi:hypothetical protein